MLHIKYLRTLATWLLGGALLLGGQHALADGYGIKIAGVEITEANANALDAALGPSRLTSGSIVYKATEKTLEFSDVTLSAGEENALEFTQAGEYTLVVEGEPGSISSQKMGIVLPEGVKLTIKSRTQGMFSITGTTHGVKLTKAELVINGGAVLIVAEQKLPEENPNVQDKMVWAIQGDAQPQTTLRVLAASLTLQARITNDQNQVKKKGICLADANVSLISCSVVTPKGAVVDNPHGVKNSDGQLVAETLEIEESLGLEIAGIPITRANAGDLASTLGPDILSGEARFNTDTHELWLGDNASINGGEKPAIRLLESRTLNLALEGSCTLSSKVNAVELGSYALATVAHSSGSPAPTSTLTVTSPANAFNLVDAQLSLGANITCILNGAKHGIAGTPSSQLYIQSRTTIASSAEGAIVGVEPVLDPPVSILDPSGAIVSSLGLTDATNTPIKSKVEIGMAFGVRIAGLQITDLNASDLTAALGASKATGNIRFANYTLYLMNNATIDGGDSPALEITNDDDVTYTIDFRGNAQLKSTTSGLLLNRQAKLITLQSSTDGMLSFTSTQGNAIELQRDAKLTLKYGSGVTATGEKYGIVGSDAEELEVAVQYLQAEGKAGAIAHVSLKLKGEMSIIEPTGARYDEAKHSVVDAEGNVVKGRVTLNKPTPAGFTIASIPVNSSNADNLVNGNTITGQRVHYDFATKTLTLQGATIDGGITANEMDFPSTLTIKLLGANRITSQGDGFAVPKLRITGAGTLTVKSNSSAYKGDAYAYNGKSLMVDGGCTVELEGDTYGIEGNGATLTVNKSTLKAKGGVYDIDLSGYSGWDDCTLKEPEGAKITEEDDTYSVTKDGELVVEEWVVFRPATPAVYCTYTLQTTPAEASLLVMDNEGSEYKAGDPIPAGTILTVKAAEGWELKELKVAGQAVQLTDGKYSMPANADFTLEATLDKMMGRIEVKVLGEGMPQVMPIRLMHGTVEMHDGDEIEPGETLTVEVGEVPNMVFHELRLNGVAQTPKAGSTSTFELTMPAGKALIEVVYEKNSTPTQFTVTFAAPENGRMQVLYGSKPLESGSKQDEGAELKVIATPSNGYELQSLSVAGMDVTVQVVNGAYTFTLTKDTEIVATFKPKGSSGQQFTLSFVQPSNGALKVLRNTDEVAPGSKLDEGTELKVITTPSNGYELQALTVAGEDVTAQVVKGVYTFTLKADTQIAATFKEVKKNIINPVESSLLATLEVYPIPFHSELHLQNASELQHLCMLNSAGQEVVRLRHNGSNVLILPTTDLPAGFYILRLTDRQGGTRTLRVVKR